MNLNTKKTKFRDSFLKKPTTNDSNGKKQTPSLDTDGDYYASRDNSTQYFKLPTEMVLPTTAPLAKPLINKTTDRLTNRKTTRFDNSDSQLNDITPLKSTDNAYVEEMSQEFVLTDYNLRKLLVKTDRCTSAMDPTDAVAIQIELQANTLLMLKAIDCKLLELYNKYGNLS
jgi:hypothetical protein